VFRALLIFLAATAFAQAASQQHEAGAEFVGAVGCKSSSCHGGAGEKRSQYITWTRKDYHTRGYTILLDARSERIAEAAGVPEMTTGTPRAATSGRCTVCHSPFQAVDSSRLAPGVRKDDGVSCETCHGAAGNWLRSHTRPDWTYAMRVSAGMHDLRNLYGRANSCVACHQTLDNALLKAGHPPLVFELDSQSINEPAHWQDRDPAIGPRSWLVGQAVALREAAWRARTEPDPSADAQETAKALAWLLSRVTMIDPALPKVNEPQTSDLSPLQKEADQLARRGQNWNADNDSMTSMLRTVAETDSEFVTGKQVSHDALFYRAQRATLAIERLAVATNVLERIDKELTALRLDVQRHYDFDVPGFAQHLKALRAKL
jgi:hypothetical protein